MNGLASSENSQWVQIVSELAMLSICIIIITNSYVIYKIYWFESELIFYKFACYLKKKFTAALRTKVRTIGGLNKLGRIK